MSWILGAGMNYVSNQPLRLASPAENVHARYAAIFLAVTGTYCGIPISYVLSCPLNLPQAKERSFAQYVLDNGQRRF